MQQDWQRFRIELLEIRKIKLIKEYQYFQDKLGQIRVKLGLREGKFKKFKKSHKNYHNLKSL
jgi:hypothetical protein